MKAKLINLLPLIIGCLLAALLISHYSNSTFVAEEFALGEETSSYFATYNSTPIHINRFSEEEINAIKNGWSLDGKKDVVMILGNSQTHGINHISEGEKTYNELLFKQLYPKLYTVAHSLPNANLQEFLLSFNYLKNQFPIKHIVIPVFYDDLREDGIRDVFFPLFNSKKYAINDSSEICKKINFNIASFSLSGNSDTDLKALKKTTQEITENYLDNALSNYWPTWASRPTMRGEVFSGIYKLRNSALGINAQTVRKMIPLRYNQNIAALTTLIEQAKKDGINVSLYIPPIRNDIALPYDLDEYALFKTQIEKLANENTNVQFLNFENIVPGPLWGLKVATNVSGKPEYDFMHFKYRGHQILDSALYQNLKYLLQ